AFVKQGPERRPGDYVGVRNMPPDGARAIEILGWRQVVGAAGHRRYPAVDLPECFGNVEMNPRQVVDGPVREILYPAPEVCRTRDVVRLIGVQCRVDSRERLAGKNLPGYAGHVFFQMAQLTPAPLVGLEQVQVA